MIVFFSKRIILKRLPKHFILNKKFIFGSLLTTLLLTSYGIINHTNVFRSCEPGDKIDSLNNVYVYYNGNSSSIRGRNVSKDGYNIGLKYQCVEFVKRYYYEFYNHKMPNSYGHAKDFFNSNLKDGQYNSDRALFQYSNASMVKPEVGDLLIFGPTAFNAFGHVAIVSVVYEDEIEIIQQNSGSFSASREEFDLILEEDRWRIKNDRVLGWLRKATK